MDINSVGKDYEEEKLGLVVGNEEALRLLHKMVKLGIFHEHSKQEHSSALASASSSHPDENIDDMHKFINRAKNCFHEDENCDLIMSNDLGSGSAPSSSSGCVMTREFLTSQISKRVIQAGKISLQILSSEMNTTAQNVQQSVNQLCHKGDECDVSGSGIHQIGVDVLTAKYMDEKCKILGDAMKDRDKHRVLIHDVAMDWNLPTQFTLEEIKKRIHVTGIDTDTSPSTCFHGIHLTVDSDGSNQLITHQYENKLLDSVKGVLEKVEGPTKMCQIFKSIPLNPTQLLNHVKHLCHEEHLDGSLHIDESSANVSTASTAAIYTPGYYEKKQEEEILSFFQANGFVTMDHGDQLGLSKKRLVECILQNSSATITLNKCLIHPGTIIKVQSLVEDSIEAQSFIHLSPHLPDAISRTDVETLMGEHIFKTVEGLAQAGSLIILSNGETYFFSFGMVDQISSQCIQPLIDEFAKPRAVEITKTMGASAPKDFEEGTKCSSKGDRKQPKASSSSESDTISYGKVSLSTLAKAISEMYPELLDMQSDYRRIGTVSVKEPSWDNIDGDDHVNDFDEGPLYVFCRRTFGSSQKFEEDCAHAVQKELKKLVATKIGTTVLSRGLGSSKVKNDELPFEESFKISCQWLQVFAKFPNSDSVGTFAHEAKNNFLNGCAADFTRVLTEYCLLKHGIDDINFNFFDPNEEDGDGEESFFFPAYATRRYFRKIFLSCHSSKGEENPLKVLRNILPGSSGIELARMWKYCGGQNYNGGAYMSEDGQSSFIPGDFDRFLSHIQESCLAICGLPFKVLDKKSEKKIFFGRKKELRIQLQDSILAKDVTELSIMLLLQQVENKAICGNEILSLGVCALVSDEDKLPPSVADALQNAASLLKDGKEVPLELVAMIKEWGQSKDIAAEFAQ